MTTRQIRVHCELGADAERLLETFRSRLWELSELISREYFTHAQWRLPLHPVEMLP